LGLGAWELLRGLPVCRRIVKEIVIAVVRLDLAALALWRRIRPPRYELAGSCQRRGACCTQIVAAPPQAIVRRPALMRAFAGFHRLLHNFHVVGTGPQGELIFRCGYVGTDGRCGIYRLRPRLCRTYPLLPYFRAPKILPGCGYRVRLRGMGTAARLPIVEAHVGTHHPTPIRRPNDGALEHAEDFVLTTKSSCGKCPSTRAEA
jgi:hypothetical protein